jgi:hypothetical protein
MQTGVTTTPDIPVLRDRWEALVKYATDELKYTREELAGLVTVWVDLLVEREE